jgi:hypothetical protein
VSIVTIDQTTIDAPEFPRDVVWWHGFLPLWFSDYRWYEQLERHRRLESYRNAKAPVDIDITNITVDDVTHIVTIVAKDRKHAREIFNHLRRSPISKHLPERAIRLVE